MIKTIENSIWGAWWTSFRKWFYTAWLIYETSIVFYRYALSTHQYLISTKEHLGNSSAQLLAVLGSTLTFAICFLYLTVPATIALFRYFKAETISQNKIEKKIKIYL